MKPDDGASRPEDETDDAPEGIDEVRYVCGLAATAEEHMGVLAALAEVLDDETSLERLRTTSDPAEVVQILDPA